MVEIEKAKRLRETKHALILLCFPNLGTPTVFFQYHTLQHCNALHNVMPGSTMVSVTVWTRKFPKCSNSSNGCVKWVCANTSNGGRMCMWNSVTWALRNRRTPCFQDGSSMSVKWSKQQQACSQLFKFIVLECCTEFGWLVFVLQINLRCSKLGWSRAHIVLTSLASSIVAVWRAVNYPHSSFHLIAPGIAPYLILWVHKRSQEGLCKRIVFFLIPGQPQMQNANAQIAYVKNQVNVNGYEVSSRIIPVRLGMQKTREQSQKRWTIADYLLLASQHM